MVCTAGNRKEIAEAKSEKEERLKYIIQPFAREFFDIRSSVQLLVKRTSTSFSL